MQQELNKHAFLVHSHKCISN